jgi:putative ABC transport system permease protein
VPLWPLLRARLRGLLHRNAVADEIREELEFHVRMRAEHYERAGDPPAVARRLAIARVGNLATLQDRGYDERGGGVMETVGQDVRYGLRLLRRQPSFSAVAIVTLALGIGLSTALASVLDAALLRPLPYAHPEQLVRIGMNVPQRNGRIAELGLSWDDVQVIRSAAHDVTAISVWRNFGVPPIVDGPTPERLRGMEIDDAYFGLYSVTPAIGRLIQADDLRDDAPLVLVLGYDYWQRQFHGSADVLGRTLRFDDGVFTVVGALPKTFERATPIWRPLRMAAWLKHIRGSGAAIEARLCAGVPREVTERELTDVLSRLPGGRPGQSARLTSLLDSAISRYRTTAEILAGAVGLILVIACVNVAGLLVARGATRQPELAVRAAMGAGRSRLIRQLLTESLVLALIGGLAGALVAWWSLDALVANIPMSLPADAPATLNWRVLAFTAALAMTTGLLFGLSPALSLSRVRLSSALTWASRRAGSSFSRRGAQALVTVETALALVLLMGAGLMLRSFSRILDVNLGFRPDAIVTVESAPVVPDPATYAAYYTRLVETVRVLPGVAAAGAIDDLPLAGSATFVPVSAASAGDLAAGVRSVLPGYFEAMGLAARAGRLPTDADLTGGRRVVVVNETAAKLFASGQAVGQSITVDKEASEVIGVVADIRFNGPIRPVGFGGPSSSPPIEVFRIYRPAAGTPPRALILVVRPSGRGAGLGDRLRQAAQQVGPKVLVERVRTGEDWLDATILTPRRRTVLLTLLGGLGLVLALVGLFGMTAYAVARRTQEIGVRMAFGAQPGDVVLTMLKDATLPVGVGLAVGLGASALATRVISTFLFETTPTDAATFAAVGLTLAVAALVAAWIPARRAARVDPVAALRTD